MLGQYFKQKTGRAIQTERKRKEEESTEIPPAVDNRQLYEKLYRTPALPPIKGPIQYAQTMLQSNTMTMMMMTAASGGGKTITQQSLKHTSQPQKLTRRDITD